MGSATFKCLPPSNTIREITIPGVTGGANVSALCMGPDGRIWAGVENYTGVQPVVIAVTPAGVISQYPVGAVGDNFGGVCAGPDGNIWIGDSSTKTLYKIRPSDGTILGSYLVSTITDIAGVRPGSDGNLYVANNGGSHLAKVSTAGVTLTVYNSPTTGGGCHGLNSGPDGNGNTVLWFAEQLGSANKVAYFNPATSTFTEFSVGMAPFSVVPGGDGNIYFTAEIAGKYGQLLLPSGTVSTWTAPDGTSASPRGIWADTNGNVWYSEHASNKLVKFPTGSPATTSTVTLPTASSGPDKIVQGIDGFLWLTEHDVGKLAWIVS